MNGPKGWLAAAALALLVVYLLWPGGQDERSRSGTFEVSRRSALERLRMSDRSGRPDQPKAGADGRQLSGEAGDARQRMAERLARLRSGAGKGEGTTGAAAEEHAAARGRSLIDARNRALANRDRAADPFPAGFGASSRAAAGRGRSTSAYDSAFSDEPEDLEGLKQVALGSNDPDERADAVREIMSMEGEVPRDTMREVLNDPNPDVRAAAVEEMAGSAEKVPVELFTEAMKDPDPEVRLAALDEIATSLDPIPFEILAIAVDDPDPEIRAEAASLIDESEDPQVRSMLNHLLTDPDEDVRSDAESYAD